MAEGVDLEQPAFHLITGASGAGKSTLLAALYRICILPKVPVRERAAFVLAQLGADAGEFDPRELPEA